MTTLMQHIVRAIRKAQAKEQDKRVIDMIEVAPDVFEKK